MTTIYLINNSLTINNLVFPESESLKLKREKRILSIEGEEEARRLVNLKELDNVNKIYASGYVMSIATAKYLANKLELDIVIDSALGERAIGTLGDKKIRMVTEMQENDFDYRLPSGESLNEVKVRMNKFLKNILMVDKDKTIALFTHNVAITALLSIYCDKGFNFDNRLILNYKEKAIIDGTWNGINIIKLEFEDLELVNITREK